MISIVSTLYRSSNTIFDFIDAVLAVQLDDDFELVLVSDGDPTMTDELEDQIINRDPRIRFVKLSRNFGHHTAIFCGIEQARGERIVVLDSDLEEDPALIPSFLEELQKQRCSIVIGVQESRNKDSLFGSLYWRLRTLENSLPANLCTMRAFTRTYANAMLLCGDSNFILGDLDDYVGFRKAYIPMKKTYKGESTYSLKRKAKLFASHVIIGSPKLLLSMSAVLIGLCFVALLLAALVIIYRLAVDLSPGWASILAVLLLSLCVNLFCFAVLFSYISKTYTQTKSRPRYIVESIRSARESH